MASLEMMGVMEKNGGGLSETSKPFAGIFSIGSLTSCDWLALSDHESIALQKESKLKYTYMTLYPSSVISVCVAPSSDFGGVLGSFCCFVTILKSFSSYVVDSTFINPFKCGKAWQI